MTKSKWQWRQLDENTDVAKVPGGLIFNTTGFEESGNGIAATEALCFVPVADEEAADKWLAEHAEKHEEL